MASRWISSDVLGSFYSDDTGTAHAKTRSAGDIYCGKILNESVRLALFLCYLSIQATNTSNFSNLVHDLVSGDLAIPVFLKAFRNSFQAFQDLYSAWLYLPSL